MQLLTIDAEASPSALHSIRRAVAEAAAGWGAGQDAVDRARLAVTEACGNVVRHAYGAETGLLHVTMSLEADTMVLVVADDGAGLGMSSEHGLGAGLAIIRAVSESVTVELRADGPGTEVTMRIPLADEARIRRGCAAPGPP